MATCWNEPGSATSNGACACGSSRWHRRTIDRRSLRIAPLTIAEPAGAHVVALAPVAVARRPVGLVGERRAMGPSGGALPWRNATADALVVATLMGRFVAPQALA